MSLNLIRQETRDRLSQKSGLLSVKRGVGQLLKKPLREGAPKSNFTDFEDAMEMKVLIFQNDYVELSEIPSQLDTASTGVRGCNPYSNLARFSIGQSPPVVLLSITRTKGAYCPSPLNNCTSRYWITPLNILLIFLLEAILKISTSSNWLPPLLESVQGSGVIHNVIVDCTLTVQYCGLWSNKS